MTKLWLLLLMVIPLQLIHSQELKHAPTVAQCRADQRLWLSPLEQFGINGVTNVSYKELSAEMSEMVNCANIDPVWGPQYTNTLEEISAVQLSRVENFFHRHNLYDQFLAEDAQGKR